MMTFTFTAKLNLRFLSTLMTIFIIILSQFGCGMYRSDYGDTISDASSASAAVSPEDVENTWNLKGISEISENTSPEALQVQFGAQIALDEINATGGINDTLLAFCSSSTDQAFHILATDTSMELWYDHDEFLLSNITKPVDFSESQKDGTLPQAPLPFCQKYKQMYGSEPDFYTTTAYCFIYYLRYQLEEYDATPNMTTAQLADIFAETNQSFTFEEMLKYVDIDNAD